MMRVIPLLSLLSFGSASALEIVYDYTYDTGGFFATGSDARAVLEEAAAFYSDVIEDSLLALVPVPPNTLDLIFDSPATGSELIISSSGIPANTVRIYVGARDLPGLQLGAASSGGSDSFGTDAWLDLVDARGQVGTVFSPGANEMSTWGGSITVDTKDPAGGTRVWDYSLNASSASGPHLLSVVVHEIAHVLGFGVSDSWYELQSGGFFHGTDASSVYGGSVPLAPTAPSHWQENILSPVYGTALLQETAMDSLLDANTVTYMTELDLAGLADVGWEIAPAPLVPVAPPLVVERLETGEFSIGWTGLVGFDYVVESSPDLESDNWSPVTSPMSGTGTAMTYAVAPSGTDFFRISVTVTAGEPLLLASLPGIAEPAAAGSLRQRRLRAARHVACACH